MTPPRSDVQVILPCLDEAAALPWVMSRVPAGYGILVVDNGSTDGSPELARSGGAHVVVAERRGYGSACHAGLVAATAVIVVMMDCDGSVDPAQLPGVVAPLLDDTLDLVIGARRPVSAAAFRWPLRLANRELARRVRRRTGVALRDVGPVRAAYRSGLLDLDLVDRRSGYPAETVVRAADAGWRIGGIDVDYAPRRGRSKVTGTPIGAWRAMRDMTVVLRQPALGLPR